MQEVDELRRGRELYARRAWADAFDSLARAAEETQLAAVDLELLATSASMAGRLDVYVETLERIHRAYLDEGDALAAARAAIWLGMSLAVQGELGPAAGWFGRAERLIDREGRDCVERGYLLVPAGFQRNAAGDFDGSFDAAAEAAAIGERFGDVDLFAMAVHIQGVARVSQGRVAEGLRLLDEAMVAVTAGEVSPIFTGLVYCSVIACCEEAYEPRRAHEWTNALTRWCEEQPQLVSFTGRCLAHRAGIKQLHGAWAEALAEARTARERAEQAMNHMAAGQALYQEGELLRLQGEFAAAESAFRDASRYGREPQPGLALLRLAQGQTDAAAAAIRRALDETTRIRFRERRCCRPTPRSCSPSATSMPRATASSELAEIAADSEGAMLEAIAAHVRGAVELAAGRPASRTRRVSPGMRRVGRSSMRRIKPRASAWSSGSPVERSATRTQPASSSRRRAMRSRRSVLRPTSHAWSRIFDRRPAPNVTGSARASSKSCGWSPPARRTARSRQTLVVSEHTVARHVQNILTSSASPREPPPRRSLSSTTSSE